MGRYDAIFVGAGVSGLLSALALSKEGKRVLVLEKGSEVGGNLRTYKVGGYTVDTGVHAITHVDNGPLSKLMGDYFDLIPTFLPFGNYYVRQKEKLTVFPWTAQAWVNFDVLPQKDRIQIISLLGSSVASSVFNSVDKNKSIYDFLKNNDFSPQTWRFIDILSYFMSGKSMKETPLWRLLKGARYTEETPATDLGDKLIGHLTSFKKLIAYDGSYHQAYPRGGVGSITDAILMSFPKDMVDIRVNSEITQIDGKKKVEGVHTRKGSYKTDLLIYSGYMSDLPNLTDDLPPNLKKSLDTLEKTKSITTWLGFSEKIKEFDYMGSEIWFGFDGSKHYWGMPTSQYNECFAPKGKMLVGFTAIQEDSQKKDEKRLLEAIYTAVPKTEEFKEFKHTQFIVPEKAAITVDSRFPNPVTPIKGLYLVGTDTDTRSMGVTRASFSVMEVLTDLKRKKLI